MSSRVLLTGPAVNAEFNSPLGSFDLETDFVPEPLKPDVLDRIAEGDFDGVVCQADNGEALDCITRIRSRNSTVPIVLVSSHPDSGFEQQARTSGATSVVTGNLSAAVVAENVAHILKLKIAMQELTDRGRMNQELRKDLREAVQHKRSLLDYRSSVNRHWMRRSLLPLLIDNDPEAAFEMVKAFEKAGVYAPLPIMKTLEDAGGYLQGLPPFEDRGRSPLPNIFLFDFHPALECMDLIEWIRKQPELVATPVVLLSTPSEQEALQQAYGRLVNSVLVKPREPNDLADLIRAVDHYWTRVNVGRPM